MKKQLNEVIVGTDRWANRAISPLDFKSEVDQTKPAVVVHPGWGKRPEMLTKLLFALAERGAMPIGVDTRFGYADRGQSHGYNLGSRSVQLFKQSYQASNVNPFFKPQSTWENRYRLRRPTGLIALCLGLGFEDATLFGHSEGGRVVTTVVAESDVLIVPRLVVANAVGTGDSSKGTRRMLRNNTQNNYVLDGTVDMTQGVLSAIESAAYAATHPRRFHREYEVIKQANIWPMLDAVAKRGTDVSVLHAKNDPLIEFASSSEAAASLPAINFIPTEGTHSNVYTNTLTEQIADLLTA